MPPVNGKLRDERLCGEAFCSLRESKVLIERWRTQYNTVRPHSLLEYRPATGAVAQPQDSITVGSLASLRPPQLTRGVV